MKPVTAFWLAVIPLLIAGNVLAWGRNHEWVSLACVCLLVLTFAFWVNEGRNEFRQRRDMEKLIKGLIEESIALKKMLIIVTNARLGKTDDNR